ncbi:MAG: nickel-dependent lactate racemase [Nitrosopumilaceae archaeon]
MSYSISYGKEKMYFSIPKTFSLKTAKIKTVSPIKNVYEKTHHALMHPINSSSLPNLINGIQSVCIVVTDNTRKCPDKELLIPILEILEKKIKKENITILIASGMHKKMNYDEKVEKYGKLISDNYQIIDHDAIDETLLAPLGFTKNGHPVKISKFALESDFLIALGVVEPHQFAGYSGGYKTVSIGIADDYTISRTHSTKVIKKSNIKVGQIENNPIYDEINEIGKKTGLQFIVNVILGTHNEVLEIAAGEPIQTHKTLIKKLKQICEISLKKSYDVIICEVGHPKDSNLYQTTRAASYLYFANTPIINHGGYIIIPSPCPEGSGTGIGEKRFFSILKNKTLDEILQTNSDFKAGEQRAFFIAEVLKNCKVIIVGCKTPDIIKEAKMIPAKDMETAFDIVKRDFNNAEMLFIPNVLSTLPVIH